MKLRDLVLALTFTTAVLGPGHATAVTRYTPRVFEQTEETKLPAIAIYVSNTGCSAVAVGPHVLLTAAHCVPEGKAQMPKFFGRWAGKGTCSCHPDYLDSDELTRECGDASYGRPSEQDLALCVFKKTLPEDFHRSIETTPEVTQGARILFAGLGCADNTWCGGCTEIDKTKTGHGFSTIEEIPGDSTWIIEGNLNEGDSALCDGDSGGPAFVAPAWDKVVAINREGCLPKEPDGTKTLARSALTPLSSESTIDWMCAWVAEDEENRQIGGLDCPP